MREAESKELMSDGLEPIRLWDSGVLLVSGPGWKLTKIGQAGCKNSRAPIKSEEHAESGLWRSKRRLR